MDEDDDFPPMPTEQELRKQIEEGLADAAAGRTLPAAVVLAKLEAAIARMRPTGR